MKISYRLDSGGGKRTAVLLLLGLLASTVGFSPVAAQSAGVVQIEVPAPGAGISIENVNIRAGRDFPYAASSSAVAGPITRMHWKLGAAELAQLPAVPAGEATVPFRGTDFGFDMWDAVNATRARPGSFFVMSFSVRSPEPRAVVLAIGCSDEAFVLVNGRHVFATVGRREFIKAQNLAVVPVVAGDNSIEVMFRKNQGWKVVPELHNSDEWLTSIELFADEETAWSKHRRQNAHLVDIPIVGSLSDVRFEAKPPASEVRFESLDGKLLAEGNVGLDGVIEWRDANLVLTNAPTGVLTAGGASEAIVVLGSRSLEEWSEARTAGGPENLAWKRRVAHLLKPEFIDSRDYWWARKLVLAASLRALPTGDLDRPGIRAYRPSRVKFGWYESRIDGTTQFFRYYVPDDKDLGSIPLVVLLPPVNDPVRPYLESYELSDLRTVENAMTAADDAGVALFWPGAVEADFGGELTRTWLAESLNAFQRQVPQEKLRTFLLGTCSSGITAIGFAEDHLVSGVVLQSPVVSRDAHSSLNGVPADIFDWPVDVVREEQIAVDPAKFGRTPFYLYVNMDIPGHGDLAASKEFEQRLKRSGSEIESGWPVPEKEFLWGERAQREYLHLFQWIARRASATPPLPEHAVEPNFAPARGSTVKSALLRGFAVQRAKDSATTRWLENWAGVWAQFRGERWRYDEGETKVPTLVNSAVLSPSAIKALVEMPGGNRVEAVLQPEWKDIPADAELWGVALLPREGGEAVQVFRSPPARLALPRVELLVDGNFRTALWHRRFGDWTLVGLWR